MMEILNMLTNVNKDLKFVLIPMGIVQLRQEL